MKKLRLQKLTLLICISFLVASHGFSQTVNGIPLKELNEHAEYIRVSESEIYLSKKINIYIDYGQVNRIKDSRVLDKDGSSMKFNSMIEVLNFMSSIGYELVNGGDNISSFLLKKRGFKYSGKLITRGLNFQLIEKEWKELRSQWGMIDQ